MTAATMTAATTDRQGRRAAPAALVALLAVAATTIWVARPELLEDDRLVDKSTPAAQRAIAAARDVVAGDVVDVRRDVDNGKWEVTLRRGERDYEVELAPNDLSLLRVDYD
jgi:hypothetical protein